MLSRINTLFILGLLGSAYSIQKAVTVNAQRLGNGLAEFDSNPDVPFTAFTTNYSAVNFPEIANNDLIIDSKFIHRFISNKYSPDIDEDTSIAGMKQEFVDRVIAVRALYPAMAKWIDLPFTHLEKFSIYVYSDATHPYLETAEIQGGAYQNYMQLLIIRGTTSGNSIEDYQYVRTLFRMAAMQTVQQTLSKTKTITAFPFYPFQDKEYKKVDAMINAGTKAILKLAVNLVLADAGELDHALVKKYNALREKCRDVYLKFYAKTINRDNKDKIFEDHEIGTVRFISGLGKVELKKLTTLDDGEHVMTLVMQDPLWAATVIIQDIIETVEMGFSQTPELHIMAFDVALQTYLPQEIIEYFYPEYFSYTNNLIDRALQTPVSYKNDKPTLFDFNPFITFTQFDQMNALSFADDDSSYIIENAFEHFRLGHYFANIDSLDLAKSCMNNLIKHNIYPAKANLHLARYEHLDGNDLAAKKHFDTAKKLHATFHKSDIKLHDELSKKNVIEMMLQVESEYQQRMRSRK